MGKGSSTKRRTTRPVLYIFFRVRLRWERAPAKRFRYIVWRDLTRRTFWPVCATFFCRRTRLVHSERVLGRGSESMHIWHVQIAVSVPNWGLSSSQLRCGALLLSKYAALNRHRTSRNSIIGGQMELAISMLGSRAAIRVY